MRLSLHRIPRESKVAAVVLGAALVQVGVLAALGLRSTQERQRAFEGEIAEQGRRVAEGVVFEASRTVTEEEHTLARELARDDDTSPWDRVRGAMERKVSAVFEYAYLVDAEGRLLDYQRPPYPPAPAAKPSEDARRELDAILLIERADPARAMDAARALADTESAHEPHDVVAVAVALQSGWRAAYARSEFERARGFAERLLASYRTIRDDRGPLGESEPMGPAASAVLCDVIYRSLVAAPHAQPDFVEAVAGRRVQAQKLRPLLSDSAYRVEVEACQFLSNEATLLSPELRGELRNRLGRCDAIDQVAERAASVDRALLRDAVRGASPIRFQLDTLSLLTVIPIPSATPRAAGDVLGAAFMAPPSALKFAVLEPAVRGLALPEGAALVVRDAAGHDFVEKSGGPLLGEEVKFGTALPGVKAGIVLADLSVLERETTSARRLWLAILAGAALAVFAASLLAIRAVMREVRLARMKSDFVSNLSHELRTPLTSLRMFVETLQQGRVRDEADAAECLSVIAQETERLQSLVERVLQFASFTRGRAPIELKSADAGEVARRAVSVFRKKAEVSGARIELDIADPLPESILDRDAILQVLLNLLDNAVKYAGHDGARIRVSVRPAGPAGTAAGRGVVIEVEDDGPGVPEKERELVFEEFYRGDDTLSRRVEGTGIGLALARRIALAHGGRIEVARSNLGGASFRMTLPEAAAGRRLALEAASSGGNA